MYIYIYIYIYVHLYIYLGGVHCITSTLRNPHYLPELQVLYRFRYLSIYLSVCLSIYLSRSTSLPTRTAGNLYLQPRNLSLGLARLHYITSMLRNPHYLPELQVCCEQSLPHISRYIRRWIPVSLITADLFRSVVRSPVMHPEDVGSTPGSVTFPPPGFDGVLLYIFLYLSICLSITASPLRCATRTSCQSCR